MMKSSSTSFSVFRNCFFEAQAEPSGNVLPLFYLHLSLSPHRSFRDSISSAAW
jgi:hypothetical protein